MSIRTLILCGLGALLACDKSQASSNDTTAVDAGVDADPTDDVPQCAVYSSLVSYDMPATITDPSDSRCSLDANGACTINLRGYLFIPDGVTGPAPVIVWNHGSELEPGRKCAIAEYFVPKGFVVFVPHRRGYGKSTGEPIATYVMGAQDIPTATTQYMELQANDVKSAVAYVQGLPSVDASRLVIMGHSYGGIETLYTNQTDVGQKAVVELCGGSESWDTNMVEHAALVTAVDNAVAPIFFGAPADDVNTTPTIMLSNEAGVKGQQYQSAIYPKVNAGTPQDNHAGFVTDPAQVAIWGPGALDFMHRYGI